MRSLSLVDGELILYPVLRPCDWQITLSGEWLNKPERLARIDVIGTKLTRKVDQEGDFPPEYPPEVWYHLRLEFCNNMLPLLYGRAVARLEGFSIDPLPGCLHAV